MRVLSAGRPMGTDARVSVVGSKRCSVHADRGLGGPVLVQDLRSLA